MFFYIEYILQLFKNLFEFVIMNMIKLNIKKLNIINTLTLTNESYRLLYIL